MLKNFDPYEERYDFTSEIWKATEQRLIGHLGYGTGNDLTNNTAFSTQYLTDENRYKLDQGWKSMPDPVDPSKTLLYSDTDFRIKFIVLVFS